MGTLTDVDLEALVGMTDPPPDEAAHIVKRDGDRSAQEVIAEAASAGVEVEALCGYRWVPKGIAPDSLEACTPCLKAWETMGGTL